MNTQDPKYQQKSKPISPAEPNYFVHFAMRYPVYHFTFRDNNGIVALIKFDAQATLGAHKLAQKLEQFPQSYLHTESFSKWGETIQGRRLIKEILYLGDNNGIVALIKFAAQAALGAHKLAQSSLWFGCSNAKYGFETFFKLFQIQKKRGKCHKIFLKLIVQLVFSKQFLIFILF